MGVDQAVDLWREHMQPFAGNAKLVSPAVTNGGPPMGITWLVRRMHLSLLEY